VNEVLTAECAKSLRKVRKGIHQLEIALLHARMPASQSRRDDPLVENTPPTIY